MELSFSLLPTDKKNMMEYEKMRLEAFGFGSDKNTVLKLTDLIDSSLLVVGLFYNQELDALAYITNKQHSLYIEQLFVRKNMQGKHLHLGQALLQYILDNKAIFEQHFKEVFTSSRLMAIDEMSKKIYKTFGYQEESYYRLIKKL